MNLSRSFFTAIVSVAALLIPVILQPVALRAASAHRSSGAPAAIAQVRYIYRGFGVAPPHQARRQAKLRDSLFDKYGVQTRQNQKASVGFVDGTVVHFNQDTEATLQAHVTEIHHGEAAEYLAPGTAHMIQTAAAVAAANGTTFDVRAEGATSVFVVLHGALLVRNSSGNVLVTTNHETTVVPHRKPAPPSPVDAKAVFAWTDGIPTPDLGEDIALSADGGQIIGFSSQRDDSGDTGHVLHINDGLLSQGWESGDGKVSNQTVTAGFFGNNFYRISDIIIDPAATYGDPSSEDLKNFAIRVSSSGKDNASFTTIYHGHCLQKDTLQHFKLPVPVRAKYVQLVAIDNYGSRQRIAVAEWEVVATASLFALPSGITVNRSGDVYVSDANSDRINKLSPKGKIIAHWGKKGSRPGQFLKPGGIALDRRGNVYVVDTFNSRIQKFSSTGKLLARFGAAGLHAGEFFNPQGVALDSHGNIYVTDLFRIQKLSPRGKVLHVFSYLDSGAIVPSGIAVNPQGDIFVTDEVASHVVELDPTGKIIKTYGSPGTDPGQFSFPTAITLDRQGNLYVADSFNSRVEKFAASGHVTAYGSYGQSAGQFFLPEGIAIDGKGNLYVTDTHNGRVQKLSASDGTVRAVWGKYATVPQVLGRPAGLAVDPRGNVWITDNLNDRVQERTPNGHVVAVVGYHGFVPLEGGAIGLGQFDSPEGIAINRQGEIYVADATNSRIEELAPRGPIGILGGPGHDPGKFTIPKDVAVDMHDNIYVADTILQRIQEFSPKDKLLKVIDLKGKNGRPSFYPEHIAVDHEGNIYVTSPTLGNDDRIFKLAPDGTVLTTFGDNTGGPSDMFYSPHGLYVDRHNHLWLADTSHGLIRELSTAGKLLATFTVPGYNSNVESITVDKHGYVYAGDTFLSRIVKFSPRGKVVAIWS